MKISNFKFQISNSQGFSIIEVILAAAMFMLFSTAAIITVLQGFNTNRLGGEETIANQFATEGIEAVKSIKNQAYSNLVNTSGCSLNRVGNVWVFDSPCATDTLTHNSSDNYIRQVKVESVNRDGSGNIVLPPSGTIDPDTKKIASTVSWNFNSARPESVILTSYLSDWRKPIDIGGPIMMVYSKNTNIPYYRTWDGSSWSAEAATQTTFYGNINYIVLKSSRTRNEAILGILDANGVVYVQVWNGASWQTPTLIATVGTTLAGYRGFDIEYEKNSDKAIIVYLPNSTSADPAYRTWDGNTWSSETTITAPPTTGVVRWIELAANPSTSNEIAMIMLDENMDVYGMVWNGTTWENMGVSSVWDATASTATKKAIDVAYEENSGRAIFIWADSATDNQMYRIWNGTSLTAATTLTIANSGGIGEWIKLVSRPNSNELLYGVQDALADLNTRKWSGSAWDTATQHPEHDGATENITSMNFDLVWETHSTNPGEAWIMWGNGATVTSRHWNGTGWDTASALTGSDDTSFVRLKADPVSGSIFAGIYEDITSAIGNRDIWERRLTGGGTTWSAENIIWGGPTAGTPVFFRIDIATP